MNVEEAQEVMLGVGKAVARLHMAFARAIEEGSNRPDQFFAEVTAMLVEKFNRSSDISGDEAEDLMRVWPLLKRSIQTLTHVAIEIASDLERPTH